MNRRRFLTVAVALFVVCFSASPGPVAVYECPGNVQVVSATVSGGAATIGLYNGETQDVSIDFYLKISIDGRAPIEFRVPVTIEAGDIVDVIVSVPGANMFVLLDHRTCDVTDTLQEAPDPIDIQVCSRNSPC